MAITAPSYPSTTAAIVSHVGAYTDTREAAEAAARSAADALKADLTDARFPAGANIVNADIDAAAAIAESKLTLASDAAAGTASRRTLGTGATQAAAGNDARLSDTRTPTDASVTEAKLATATKGVLVGGSTNAAVRPSGYAFVIFSTAADPAAVALANDVWIPQA